MTKNSHSHSYWLELYSAIGRCFLDCLTVVDMVNPGRHCFYVNDTFVNTTGFSPEEVIGKNLNLLQGPETSEDVIWFMREKFRQLEACCVDVVNYRKSGEAFLNRVVMLPATPEPCSFFLGFQNDITGDRTLSVKDNAALDVSSGEISHVLNNLLAPLILRLDSPDLSTARTAKALEECRKIFERINRYCVQIDQPGNSTGYNPFRSS